MDPAMFERIRQGFGAKHPALLPSHALERSVRIAHGIKFAHRPFLALQCCGTGLAAAPPVTCGLGVPT
jgi:hypothetical protein